MERIVVVIVVDVVVIVIVIVITVWCRRLRQLHSPQDPQRPHQLAGQAGGQERSEPVREIISLSFHFKYFLRNRKWMTFQT